MRRARRTSGPARRVTAALGAVVTLVAAVAGMSAAAAAHDTYVVQPGDTLSEIAKRLAVAVQTVAALNAIADTDHIVVGQRLVLDGDPGAAPGQGGPGDVHVVQPGETLSGIAARYGTDLDTLVTANGLSDRDLVWAGSRLVIRADTPALPEPQTASTHVVKPGETVSEIAAAYGVTLHDLVAANGLADPNLVLAGTTLSVPGGWRCPVPGAEFVNDFGARKPDGRLHEGVDLFAPRGTPVVAPVGGEVETTDGPRGGLQFRLDGDDGIVYFGTHLDRLHASGRVTAGQVLGEVGTTGNAVGSPPHLHFELHPGEGPPANPFPVLQRAC